MSQHQTLSVQDDTLRILVATDNHLGYLEKDPIRGNDSFIAFEEILKNAKKLQVDMILLGGDLFHDNKPSRNTLYKTLELLRKYTLGDRPISLEILSDQTINFPNKFGCVNYEDPNFNIEIPVFSIHGNHDDPAGEGLAALDLLSVCGFVNYFGKSPNIDDISIYPILVRKGKTFVSIYGLGNIRDERLYRTFQQKKVKLMRPIENRDSWFNIFVLHQNRVSHSPKNYVHECMLDNFLDFVVWGHEHECLITPQPSSVGEFYISQPGSSVATALSEGESKKKHFGLLEICGDQFRLKAVPFQSVRPFMMDEIALSTFDVDPHDKEAMNEVITNKIEEMIAKAEADFQQAQDGQHSSIPKPLIRLKVEYSGGFSAVNPQRFGQKFVGRVANPNEILLFYKKRSSTAKSKLKEVDKETLIKTLRPEPLDTVSIEDLIESFLTVGSGPAPLQILPESEFHLALHNFVEKEDKSAITDFISRTLRNTQQFLKDEDPQKTLDPEAIQQMITARTAVKRETDNNDNANNDLPVPKDLPDVDMANENPELVDEDENKATKATKNKSTKQTKTKTPTTKETKKYSLQLAAAEQKDETDVKPPKPKKRITSLADVLADPNPQPQKKTKQVAKDVVDIPDNDNDNDKHNDNNSQQQQAPDSVITKKWGKRKTNS